MNYEAILFDMDGVIVDTHQSVTAFWLQFARIYQVHLTEADFAQHIYGCPVGHTLDVLFPRLNAAERQAVQTRMVDYEVNLIYTAVKGVVSFLQAVQKQGIPMALVTSGEQWKVDTVTTQLDLEGTFTAQVIASNVDKGKPHPDCYLLGAHRLQKSPERCIVFEDAISGVKAAVAAGALCVGVQPLNGAPLLQAGAYDVVPDFTSVTLQVSKVAENGVETGLNLRIGPKHSLLLRSSQ